MRIVHVLIVTLIATVLGVSGAWSQAEAPMQPTVLVIDSSASMSARVRGDVTRLDAARDVLIEAMRSWRPGTELGIVAYGHRRPGDCRDIETIVPYGPLDITTTKKRLDALRARGKTPLGASITAGAKLLPSAGGAVVLVSDGVETCEADPCAVAHDLHAENPNLVVHVISYGVTDEERRALDCIASSGGGRLIPAGDPEGLTEALHLIGRMANIAPTPLPGTTEAQAETRLGLTLLASSGTPLYQLLSQGEVAWTVEPLAADGPVQTSDLRSPSFALEPGQYRVSVRFGDWTASRDVAVAQGQLNEFDVDLRLGRVLLQAAESPEGPPIMDGSTLNWELAPSETAPPIQSVLSIAQPTLLAQEGSYVARLMQNGEILSAPADVVAGQTSVVRIVVPQG